MLLSWSKCVDDWCLLDRVQADRLDGHGVFVVWRDGDLSRPSATLYVGRGWLRDEVERCQRNPIFRQVPDLRVTWAQIEDVRALDGVTSYVYQQLRPMWGEAVWTHALAVNLPAV